MARSSPAEAIIAPDTVKKSTGTVGNRPMKNAHATMHRLKKST
nr:hypothetical protein [Microbacterium hydrothermale]